VLSTVLQLDPGCTTAETDLQDSLGHLDPDDKPVARPDFVEGTTV
jgi:hypothetical protein